MLSRSYSVYTNFLRTFPHPITIKRFVRNPFGRGPKLLEGKVKTVTQFETDEFCDVENFQDLVRRVKTNEKFDEVAVEEAFTREDDFGTAVARTVEQKEIERQSVEHELFVKQQIIKRKYFKYELESNLLTYAAKQQIRYLSKLNPSEWTPETLSKCFPVTVTGVKKLLKSNYKLLTPEKIKAHDEEVEERWKLLKARKHSDSITFHTQHMWDEGKILKDNYKGNPKLPNIPNETDKIIKEEKHTKTGEFSAIIKHYMKYKKEKEAFNKTDCTSGELQVSVGSMDTLRNEETKSKKNVLKEQNYVTYDENEGTFDSITLKSRKKPENTIGDAEVLHSQFKENLKEEMQYQEKKLDSEYVKWLKKQSVELNSPQTSKPFNTNQIFTKIAKFVNDTVELKREQKTKSFYMYDEKHGYQYPTGKNIKGRIRVPSKQKKSIYKVGDCVYGADGEFLYKIPG